MSNNFEDRLNLGNEVHQLKLGSSFSNSPSRETFHTIKYDFKPASVDTSKTGKLEVSSSHQVTVTVPHLDGSGVPNTVFKGPTRDYSKKDCLLIINRDTNEITLERLTCNVNVKKTRSENSSKINQHNVPPPKMPSSHHGLENNTQRQSSKTKVSTGSRKQAISYHGRPKHSPNNIQSSPNSSYPHTKSPSSGTSSMSANNPIAPQWQPNNHLQTLPSIPIIGDYFEPIPSSKTANNTLPVSLTQSSGSNSHNNISSGATNAIQLQNNHPDIGVLSSSDSSSSGSDSDSGSDSGSDSDSDDNEPHHQPPQQKSPEFSKEAALLNEDLKLSDSNSSDDSNDD